MGVQKKNTSLFISPNNEIRHHSHQNRLKKLVPRAHFSKQVSDNDLRKATKYFSNPDFWATFGFPKTRVSSPVAPRGVYISRNDHKKQILGNDKNFKNRNVLIKLLPLLWIFKLFLPPPPHSWEFGYQVARLVWYERCHLLPTLKKLKIR